MAGYRAYYPHLLSEGQLEVELSKEESHHISSVLRLKTGAKITVFNGRGEYWKGVLKESSRKKVIVGLDSSTPRVVERKYEIYLAQVLPKGKGMDSIVRKATEIGATKIYPIISEHCEVSLNGERSEKKVERWKALAIEACKQSSNYLVPEISEISDFKGFLKNIQNDDCLKLVASLELGAKPLFELIEGFDLAKVLVFIGPEGDFSQEEYNLLRHDGFQALKLSNTVLRVETAAIYSLSILDHLIGMKISK